MRLKPKIGTLVYNVNGNRGYVYRVKRYVGDTVGYEPVYYFQPFDSEGNPTKETRFERIELGDIFFGEWGWQYFPIGFLPEVYKKEEMRREFTVVLLGDKKFFLCPSTGELF
jgi:hypothetical protein